MKTNSISKVSWHTVHQDPLADIFNTPITPPVLTKLNPILWLPCYSKANNSGDTSPSFHFLTLPPPRQGQHSACPTCCSWHESVFQQMRKHFGMNSRVFNHDEKVKKELALFSLVTSHRFLLIPQVPQKFRLAPSPGQVLLRFSAPLSTVQGHATRVLPHFQRATVSAHSQLLDRPQ